MTMDNKKNARARSRMRTQRMFSDILRNSENSVGRRGTLLTDRLRRKFERYGGRQLVGLVNSVLDVINDTRVRKSMRFARDVVYDFNDYSSSEKKGIVQKANLAVNLADNVLGLFNRNEHTFFNDNEWTKYYPEDFFRIVENATSHLPRNEFQSSDDNERLVVVELTSGRIGWCRGADIDDHEVQSCEIYITKSRSEAVIEEVAELIWSRLGNAPVQVSRESSKRDIGRKTGFVVHPDKFDTILTSDMSGKYADYARRCIVAGVNRAFLFYGPPGTGKSCMLRAIAKDLELKSMRFNIDDLEVIDAIALSCLLDVFKPDIILIDDIDRCCRPDILFDLLERLKLSVKLLMATANRRNRLDQALLRPGRFDELVPIMKLDDNVTRHVLGDLCASDFDVVKDWPIAYIAEWKLRRQFMSTEEAKSSMEELQKRIDRMMKDYGDDDEDETRVPGFLKSSDWS